jgi:hypothetical protein
MVDIFYIKKKVHGLRKQTSWCPNSKRKRHISMSNMIGQASWALK